MKLLTVYRNVIVMLLLCTYVDGPEISESGIRKQVPSCLHSHGEGVCECVCVCACLCLQGNWDVMLITLSLIVLDLCRGRGE